MRGLILLINLVVSLSACANGPKTVERPKLPYSAWFVGLAAPRYMEVWVESVDVLDRRGLGFFDVHSGVAGYTTKPEGWHKGGGKVMPMNNADLPERIYLRWQSLVEPQAYKISVQIPQWVRDEMVVPREVFCEPDQKVVTLYPNRINLGMAPGGIVKVWAGSACLGYKEVGRFQAVIEPLGPYQNNKGLYYRAPTPAAQAWIEKNGIPYGSW